MNEQYCCTERSSNTCTCGQTTTFHDTYMFYASNESKISKNITSLNFTENKYLEEFQPEEFEKVISVKDDNPVVGGATGY